MSLNALFSLLLGCRGRPTIVFVNVSRLLKRHSKVKRRAPANLPVLYKRVN